MFTSTSLENWVGKRVGGTEKGMDPAWRSWESLEEAAPRVNPGSGLEQGGLAHHHPPPSIFQP